jgi:hypothetical protein
LIDTLVFVFTGPSGFQRAGSVIVLFAFLTTARTVFASQREATEILNKELERNLKGDRLDTFRVRKKLSADDRAEMQKLDEDRHELSADIEARKSRNERWARPVQALDAALVTVGTVQWGFGDLIYFFLDRHGVQSC